MRKSDIVEYKRPLPDEIGLRFILMEEPERGRVLAEAIVNMVIRPTYILNESEIRLVEEKQ